MSNVSAKKALVGMLDDPDSWPLYPVLPVKRDREPTADEPFPWELGFLLAPDPERGARRSQDEDEDEARYRVYLSPLSVFIDVAHYEDLASECYSSPEALIADGWIVD